MWIFFIIGIIFIALGIAVHVFKLYFLISGYNTMSKAKKANVNSAGLGRLMGIYSYANGGIYIVTGILHALGFTSATIPAIIFTMISTFYLLIKSQKFDGNIYDKDGKRKKKSSKQNIFSIIIFVLPIAFVIVLMYHSTRPTKVTFLEEGLEIHGMYGDVYKWDSIEQAVLIEELPTIRKRTNGSAIGPHLKGIFSTEEMGSVRLHVNTQYPPFIHMETSNRTLIFNMVNPGDTVEILDKILINSSSGR